MNKKAKIYILLLIWTAAVVQFFINRGIDREEKIVEALAVTEASPYAAEVSAYGYYGNGFLSDEVKERMVKNLAAKLGVTSGYEVESRYSDDGEVTTLSKKGSMGDTVVKVISMNGTDETGGSVIENYILIEVVLHESVDSAYTINKNISEICEDIGVDITTNIYVGGIIQGQMTEEEMQKNKEDFLDMMNAYEVCADEFDNVYTVYGYTGDIPDFVYQNESRVNVNIAFSYDEESDLTYVHMAIPFVDKSY